MAKVVKPEILPDNNQAYREALIEETEDSKISVTFYLPRHSPQDLKYHVGMRSITLWSRNSSSEFQTIAILPTWIDPETYIMTHNNGIYEFVLEKKQSTKFKSDSKE